MYRIYNPVVNKYSRGGSQTYQLWSKNGKIWTTIGYLKSHLTMIKEAYYNRPVLDNYIRDNCVVINVLTNESFPVKLIINNPENFK
jgi:hypothetical protein